MTKFAIFELVLIQHPEVDKHSQYFLQVQLRSIVNTSKTLRFVSVVLAKQFQF